MRISVPSQYLLAALLVRAAADAFAFSTPGRTGGDDTVGQRSLAFVASDCCDCQSKAAAAARSGTALFAKKKKKKTPAAAALEQLEALEADLPDPILGASNGAVAVGLDAVDVPLSKKEQMAAEKAAKKAAKAERRAQEAAAQEAEAQTKKKARAAAMAALDGGDIPDPFSVNGGGGGSGLSKKEQMQIEKQASKDAKKAANADAAAPTGKKDKKADALKALEEVEREEEARLAALDDEWGAPKTDDTDVLAGIDTTGMSKKDIKKLRQKEEKKAAKMAAKAAKKAAKNVAAEESDATEVGVVNGGADVSTQALRLVVIIERAYSLSDRDTAKSCYIAIHYGSIITLTIHLFFTHPPIMFSPLPLLRPQRRRSCLWRIRFAKSAPLPGSVSWSRPSPAMQPSALRT